MSLRDEEGSTIKRVADLGLSLRTAQCLEQANIRTVKALAKKTPAELLEIEGFGKKSLSEVLGKLEEHGFTPHGDVEALTLGSGGSRAKPDAESRAGSSKRPTQRGRSGR